MIGEKLGRYRIVALLGSGGMGVVYQAHDDDLQRDVALKLLSSDSPDARELLTREARAAAALNHPNVCTVYEVGEDGGRVYIAMELVVGETLAERIARSHGGLASEQVVRYGVQIADALAHAHGRGVIHRDLKSRNIVLTAEGRVKVLDFGLSRRVRDEAGVEPAGLPTTVTTGKIVGTPQYMAPEVLLGEPADARSDLWALGVVLHELVTGTLPFRGHTWLELSAAILHQAPEKLPDRVPAGLRSVIGRCLMKEPAERYARVSEVRAALEALVPGTGDLVRMERATRSGGLRPWWGWVGAGLAVLAGVWLALWAMRELRPEHPPRLTQLTTNSNDLPVVGAAISPDGTHLVYADSTGLFQKNLVTREVQPVRIPEGVGLRFLRLSWFPDGQHLAATFSEPDFPHKEGIWQLSLLGGLPKRLVENHTLAAVSRDGTRICYLVGTASELWVMDLESSRAHRVATCSSGEGFLGADWSPDGRRIAYQRLRLQSGLQDHETTLETVDTSGTRPSVLWRGRGTTDGMTVAWAEPGRIVFVQADTSATSHADRIWELRVHASGQRALGRPRLVTGPESDLTGQGVVSTTRDGRTICFSQGRPQMDVFVSHVDGKRRVASSPRRVTLDERDDYCTAWLPDGSAFLELRGLGGWMSEIVRQPLGSVRSIPILSTEGSRRAKSIISASPLGRTGRLIYVRRDFSADKRPIQDQVITASMDGGAAMPVLSVGSSLGARSTLDSSTFVLAEVAEGFCRFSTVQVGDGGRHEFARVPMNYAGTSYLFAGAWDVSADGRLLALPTGIHEIVLIEVSSGTQREITLTSSPGSPEFRTPIISLAWDPGGKGLWLNCKDHIRYTDLEGRSRIVFKTRGWIGAVRPSPDGSSVAMVQGTLNTNVWNLER